MYTYSLFSGQWSPDAWVWVRPNKPQQSRYSDRELEPDREWESTEEQPVWGGAQGKSIQLHQINACLHATDKQWFHNCNVCKCKQSRWVYIMMTLWMHSDSGNVTELICPAEGLSFAKKKKQPREMQSELSPKTWHCRLLCERTLWICFRHWLYLVFHCWGLG